MQTQNLKTLHGIKCAYDSQIVTIKQSHRLEYREIEDFCVDLKKALPFKYRRSAHSWAKEVVAHNFMYELDWFRNRTEDTDLDDDEVWYRMIAFNVLYVFHFVYAIFKGE